jgi:hypothetical protein
MFTNRRGTPYFNNGYSGQIMHENPFQLHWHQGIGRNYPYPAPLQNPEWQSYQPQNPYYPQQYQPVNQPYHSFVLPQSPYPSYPPAQKDPQFLFKNPLQPQEEVYPSHNPYPIGGGFMNPYPKTNLMPKQPGGMQSLVNSFKSQDGSVDFNKMVNTAGQMMNAVSQMTSLVKGLGGIFKV